MEEKNYPTLKLESALEEIIVEAEKAHPNDKKPKGFLGNFKNKVASEDILNLRKKKVKELFFEKFEPKEVIDYKNAFDKEQLQLKTEIIQNLESQKDNLLYIEWDYNEDLPIIILGKYSKMIDKKKAYTIEEGDRGTTREEVVSVKAIKFLKPDRTNPGGIVRANELVILPKIDNMKDKIKEPEIYSIEINSIEGEETGNEEQSGNEGEPTGDEEEVTGGKRKKTRNNKKKSSKKSRKSKKKNTKKNKTKKKGKK